MKDHEIREIVNQLRDIAIEFHGAQQLRARIAHVVVPLLSASKPAAPVLDDERAARYQELISVAYVILGCLVANDIDIPERYLDAFADPDSVDKPLDLLPFEMPQSVPAQTRALTEAVEVTIETIRRQLDLISERALGSYLDKTPIVRSLQAHKKRLERIVRALSTAKEE